MAIETWTCENCGYEWEADVPPVPVNCPACGSERVKPPHAPLPPKDPPV